MARPRLQTLSGPLDPTVREVAAKVLTLLCNASAKSPSRENKWWVGRKVSARLAAVGERTSAGWRRRGRGAIKRARELHRIL